MHQEHTIETYKFLMQLGLEALKLTFLLNGGAVVALLAYLGNITSKNIDVPNLGMPLIAFLVGLILSGFSFVSAYVMQLGLFNECVGREHNGSHAILLYFSVGLIILSIISFSIGAYLAVNSFYA